MPSDIHYPPHRSTKKAKLKKIFPVDRIKPQKRATRKNNSRNWKSAEKAWNSLLFGNANFFCAQLSNYQSLFLFSCHFVKYSSVGRLCRDLFVIVFLFFKCTSSLVFLSSVVYINIKFSIPQPWNFRSCVSLYV